MPVEAFGPRTTPREIILERDGDDVAKPLVEEIAGAADWAEVEIEAGLGKPGVPLSFVDAAVESNAGEDAG